MKKLTRDTIEMILTGNTLILRRTDGAEGAVYYGVNGMAHMRHPDHGPLTGAWSLCDNGYSVDWDKGVGRVEWALGYTGSEIIYLDGNGAQRASLVQLIRGDAQNLSA